jgi:hypothetical protein
MLAYENDSDHSEQHNGPSLPNSFSALLNSLPSLQPGFHHAHLLLLQAQQIIKLLIVSLSQAFYI